MPKVTIDESGNFKVPNGVIKLKVEGWGGGGGGGGVGGTPVMWGGGGGSGGDYNVADLDVTPGQVLWAQIGHGGKGGGRDQHGTDGGETWLGHRDLFRAAGGSSGKPGSNDEGPGYTLDSPHDNFPLGAAIWGTLGGGGGFPDDNSGGGGGGAAGDESGLPGPPGEGQPGGTGHAGIAGGTGGNGGQGGYWDSQPATAGLRPGGGGGGGGSRPLVKPYWKHSVIYSTANPHYLDSEVTLGELGPDAPDGTTVISATFTDRRFLTSHFAVVWEDVRTLVHFEPGTSFGSMQVRLLSGFVPDATYPNGLELQVLGFTDDTGVHLSQLAISFWARPPDLHIGRAAVTVLDNRGIPTLPGFIEVAVQAPA